MAQFNVNLAFNADTGKAKTQIMELQSLLNKIAYNGATGGTDKLQTDLHAASEAAKELQFHLNNAFNASTGNFDLSMLDRSLKTSGSNVTDLSMKLLSAGATGQQAFVKLAQSISLADQPMFRISKRMQDFAVTMKNTVKWQLSSSMLHGFMGAVQSAYGYAQDLNKSLNDIRIVTGYNTDRMAEFAEQANKAAKALSTTTTDYTNASLIYFQQGLNDAEVAERTDITIKMANVVGQSAEVVSEQLTAVWNNFDDGSKSLKYYVDVMTALGAATASSSDEISEGLSKFAAVASTVGLSYEYATAALATLTSNTRESADVVGNALKTLFARIQGLQLGETLEDGTTLNKYSKALEKIGISIYDASGGLKNMDAILDEMAAKWDTLDAATKKATAETVGGVRQYNQLIALMENWNNGDNDSMMANLKTIESSDGALQKQADIYTQSWEAAEKRVRAAAEGIYQSLIDDKFFINLNHGFANLLGGIDAFIEGAGGVKTVLTGLASIIMTVFANKIPGALQTLKYNLQVLTKGTEAAYKTIQQDMVKTTQDAFTRGDIKQDSAMGYAIEQANQLTLAKNKLARVSDQMTEKARQEAHTTLALAEAMQEEAVALKQKNEQLKETVQKNLQVVNDKDSDYGYQQGKAAQKAMMSAYSGISFGVDPEDLNALEGAAIGAAEQIRSQLIPQLEAAEVATKGLSDSQEIIFNLFKDESNSFASAFNDMISPMDNLRDMTNTVQTQLDVAREELGHLTEGSKEFADKQQQIAGLEASSAQLGERFKELKGQASGFIQTLPEGIRDLREIREAINDVNSSKDISSLIKNWQKLKDRLSDIKREGKDLGKILKGSLDNGIIEKLIPSMKNLHQNTKDTSSAVERLQQLYNNFNPKAMVGGLQAVVAASAGLGNVAMIMNQIKSIGETLTNPDLSGWEQMSAVLTGISFIVPQTIAAFNSMGQVQQWLTGLIQKHMIALAAETAAVELAAQADAAAAIKKKLVTDITDANIANLTLETAAVLANKIAKKAGLTVEEAEAVIKKALNAAKAKGVALSGAELLALIAEAGGRKVNVEQTKAQVVWQTILNALTGKWGSLILIAVAAVTALVGIGLAKWIDSIVVTQKEANAAMQEAAEAVDEEKSKLQELESELSNVQSKIEELASKGPLTLTEQAELNRLRTIEQSLANQIIQQEKLLKLKQAQQTLTIAENWTPAYNRLSSGDNTQKESGSYSRKDYGGDTGFALLGNGEYWYDALVNWSSYMMAGGADSLPGTWNAGTEDDAMFEPVMVDKTKEDYDDWYSRHGAEHIQAESDYMTVMQAYTSGILNDAQKATVEQQMAIMQEGLRGGRWASVGGDADAYFDRYFASHISNADWSSLTAADIENTSFDYASIFGENNLALAGVSADEFNQLMNQNMQIALDRKFDAKQIAELTPEQLEIFLTNVNDITAEQLDALGITIAEWVDGTVDGVYQGFNPSKWKQRYSEVNEIIEGLEIGDTISAADYALLGEEYQQYFAVQADGTAILTTKAEELKAVVQSIEVGKLIGGIESTKGHLNDFQYNTDSQGNLIQDDRYMSTENARGALGSHNAGWTYRDQDLIDYTSLVNEQYGTQFDTNTVEGWEQAIAYMEQQNALLEEQQALLAGSATSQEELNQYLEQGLITQEQYNQNFTGIIIKEAQSEGIDVDELMAYADYLRQINPDLKDNIQLTQKMALQYLKTQKGVKKMTDSFDDWSDAIKNGNKDVIRYAKTMDEIKDAYKDVFNTIDPKVIEDLNNEFLASPRMMGLMERALAGDEQAWNDWEAAVLTEINNTHSAFAGMTEGMKVKMNELTTMAANLDFSGLTPGADIQDEAFLAKLNEMSFATAEAAQVMSDNLSAVGVDAEIEEHTVTVPAKSTVTQQNGAFVVTPPGGEPFTVPISAGITQSDEEKTYTYYTLKGAKYNGRGVRPSTGSTNKNGGGGGGSKKHAERKDSGDRTRYHTIQNQLEDLSAAYDEVSEAADRAFGLEKLDLIDEQISATDDLIAKQKEYVDALVKDVPVDKAVMDAYYDKVIGGPAMEFDENGNIANYDEIEAAMHAKYNEMADKYTDDSTEWQQFEKQYEQMEKYIEDYEKYYDDLRDAEAEYQNLINQRIDLQLQKVQYKVELELDVENDEIELLEYQLSLIEDDAFKSAEAITLLTKQAESLYDQIQVNKQGLNDTLGLSLSAGEIASVMAGDLSVLEGKTFTEDQISAIRDYRDNLIALNEQFNEVRQSIEEQVMATFDAWQEKLERGSAALEHYGSILESYQNIIDIVGTDTLGISSQFMSDLSQAKVDNSIDQLEAAKSSYEAVASAQKEAQEALAAAQAAGDEESISMWEETLVTLNEEAQAASEELMAAWEEALSGIVEAFDMAVDRAVQDFNDAIYSLGGVEGLLDAFSNAQETSDLMLEDYQQIYELSKLSRDINNSIDDTENLAGKQKLKKLLGEINKLQEEGVEMSQYDLEYLQAEYQLRLAEIELEEAQNAKNTVRLQKDNEGNWSYVYTQNTDAVDEAQQKYEDALYSMQDLSSNYIDEMSEQLINTSQEMAEALAAIRVEDFASINDYYAEVERVQAQYQEEIAMQEAELQKAIDNNKELYDTDWTNYHNATGYKISDTEEFVTSFKDSLLGTLLDSESDTANFADILGQATASLTSNLMEAAATYYQNLDSAMEAAGTTTEGFAEDTKANIEAIVEASTTGAEAIDQMATEMTEAFSAITDSVTSWQETYGVAMQEIIDSNIAVIESFNDMIAALAIDEGSVTVKYDISSAPETDAAQFDTGGYTGTWGNAGKVAVLHEKELILNEDDTSNFLSAIQVTRAMLETIDLNAKQASMGVGNLVPSTVKDEVVQTLEQEVHITAEFPNVSDHNEVEEALKNLMNTASQYANRKS